MQKHGLGKYRTPFGKWLDERNLSSVKFALDCGVDRQTIDSIAGQKGYSPRQATIDKIIKAAKKYDQNVNYEKLFLDR